MDEARVDAYLARIGAARPEAADFEGLCELQRAHLYAVPFENLSIHLGEPIVLEEAALVEKIVDRRRGGFCYELNGAFGALLTALGYRVTLLSARVFNEDRVGVPFDHLALRVDLDGPLLADVGFGMFSERPLRLDAVGEQRDPNGVFRLIRHGDHGEVDVFLDDRPEYRLDTRPYQLRDFRPTCWWQQTSPESHFSRSLTCSLPTESGRVTLSGTRLIHTVDGERRERVVEGDRDLLEAYRRYFGIVLDRVPAVAART
ncbi:arylamine N-acetyltransferase [Sphaerisporangium sp. TRM90804]|uniref:arylamine N-acetyltransferase family protein n=1 Tax=Sphaerisporangium sp. TRM90804 TaxID=3031113 RepID=UPI00244AA841|nr:arylamine N-acetyltransferase [Sphaerisporangium sp. TRM90804]MDH2425599.1 arylamine N-acetyltransferase [Sphaerisporangium sp. TRM90804]